MRLINIDIFPLLPNKLDGDESEYERGYHDATDNLKALPLVDAVPVVRCRECKHGRYDEDSETYDCGYVGLAIYNEPNHYCSYGVRKEETK